MTYCVTGDFDGSDNWVNKYATSNFLAGDYARGWYLPTVAELSMMYCVKDTVNAALVQAGGTKIADTERTGYWSSSQDSSSNDTDWSVWFADGNISATNKSYSNYYVCAVRAF